MSKFSVKKPMTVFVVVILIIALGVVSVMNMTPDLLPSMDLPYVVVMTTYPGATPEQVEATVTKPLEQSLATLENIENIQSISNSNYSMVILEFAADANMDTSVVNTLQNVELVEGAWDDSIGSPNILKINPTMLPIAIAAVDMEGYDTEELSAFTRDTLINKLEGTTGIASISTGGLIESQINVVINQDKIDDLNEKLLSKANSSLAEAKSQLSTGMDAIKKAEAQLAEGRDELDKAKDETYDKLAEASAQLDTAIAQVNVMSTQLNVLNQQKEAIETQIRESAFGKEYGTTLDELEKQLDEIAKEYNILQIDYEEMNKQVAQLTEAYKQAERGSFDAIEGFDDAYDQLDAAEEELAAQKSQLESAQAQIDVAGNQALKQANLGSMITAEMVSGILQGQNFSMPAGYIQSGDVRYLVSVGDKIEDTSEVKNMFLFNVEGLGEIQLKDVTDVFVSDNSDAVYASINGNSGVLLTFSKQSNYPTATVSDNLADKFEELSKEYEGLHFTTLMDQGDYIYLIIGSIMSSLGWGAVFAILILFLFLRDIKPTLITLLSIPISVIFALALMYFSGVTLNMISLSGLAVAVGMLVDNAIKEIENIYRLRRTGVSAVKAAVAGAKQVSAAIISSTLTTVCVFVPIVFVQGLTRQLFTDMALTITYALMASLIIALTLVPAMSSKMLVKELKPESEGFKSFRDSYRKAAGWALSHKAVVLVTVTALLILSVVASLARGFIFMPDMATPQLSGTLIMSDEEADIEETAKISDKALKLMESVDGVETVGAMLSSSGGVGGVGGQTENATVSLYIIMEENTSRQGDEIAKDIEKLCKDLPCTIEIVTSSSISSYTSALGGAGVGIEIYSTDNDALQEAAKEIGKKLEKVEGIESVDNGLTEAEPELHFAVNKKKAMEKGLTVAQVYMQVAKALTTETTATSINISGQDYDVVVSGGEAAELSVKELKNLVLTGTDAQGNNLEVKLSDVADVKETESLPTISRINQKTYLKVSGEVKEGYNVTLVTADAEKMMKNYELPDGVTIEFSGENETIMDAMGDLVLMLLLGVLFVYLIMVAQFQSLKSPFIIMFTIPLAFTGGFMALLITGKELSIIAMIGFIMLVGIIVNNGIVLVDYINQLRGEGMAKRDAIIEAGATRMRPVMMTSLTTILGLTVMAFGNTAGTDMMQPVALVSIGGLAYATLMTLFVIPVIYDMVNGEEYKVVKEEDVDVSDIILE